MFFILCVHNNVVGCGCETRHINPVMTQGGKSGCGSGTCSRALHSHRGETNVHTGQKPATRGGYTRAATEVTLAVCITFFKHGNEECATLML